MGEGWKAVMTTRRVCVCKKIDGNEISRYTRNILSMLLHCLREHSMQGRSSSPPNSNRVGEHKPFYLYFVLSSAPESPLKMIQQKNRDGCIPAAVDGPTPRRLFRGQCADRGTPPAELHFCAALQCMSVLRGDGGMVSTSRVAALPPHVRLPAARAVVAVNDGSFPAPALALQVQEPCEGSGVGTGSMMALVWYSVLVSFVCCELWWHPFSSDPLRGNFFLGIGCLETGGAVADGGCPWPALQPAFPSFLPRSVRISRRLLFLSVVSFYFHIVGAGPFRDSRLALPGLQRHCAAGKKVSVSGQTQASASSSATVRLAPSSSHGERCSSASAAAAAVEFIFAGMLMATGDGCGGRSSGPQPDRRPPRRAEQGQGEWIDLGLGVCRAPHLRPSGAGVGSSTDRGVVRLHCVQVVPFHVSVEASGKQVKGHNKRSARCQEYDAGGVPYLNAIC
eukprot:gene5613-4033_t